jgi:hypothetical protein
LFFLVLFEGANALIDGGRVLYVHRHAQPLDIGQPVEAAARALGKAITPQMHLNLHGEQLFCGAVLS